MHDRVKPEGPNEAVRDIWRIACRVYRRERQKGKLDHPAHVAAVKADNFSAMCRAATILRSH